MASGVSSCDLLRVLRALRGENSLMKPSNALVAASPKLLDRVRWLLRAKHYSIRTEQAYVDWIRHFIGKDTIESDLLISGRADIHFYHPND
jgi:hypothetical protein